MHWVDRRQEPNGLQSIRDTYTKRWVDHYRHHLGKSAPGDSHWRQFYDDLSQVFLGMCGYCEEPCKGEVDHFRPKSRFPESVYEWSTWIFACHDCNHAKGEKWPSIRYVDPCTISMEDRPEEVFDFDILTGEILPKRDLTLCHDKRARATIRDLRLNDVHHLKLRREWIILVAAAIPESEVAETTEVVGLRKRLMMRSTQLSSLSRAWLAERRFLAGG